ncbi:MAG: hypothetical protein JRH11_05435 [Deltaproteobacteria bacterium]|nr:hypothetical protein [Deltaproteobacteria bacterium]
MRAALVAGGLASLVFLLSACGDDSAPPPRQETAPAPEPEVVPPEAPPAPVGDPLPEPAPSVGVGGVHICDLDASGAVRCWGGNQFGQIGDEAVGYDYNAQRSLPALVAGIDDALALYVGNFHSCVLGDDHSVACWGHDGFGQLGGTSRADVPTPRVVAGLDHPVELALGRQHTCARLRDRTVVCLGDNGWGQLGDGSLDARTGPVTVAGLSDVTAITAGRDHSCALTAGGGVSCWGAAVDGQLGAGAGNRASSGAPVAIEEVPAEVSAISAGGLHSCLLAAGVVHCWGANDAHQMGNARGGEQDDRALRPVLVLDIDGIQQIAAGGRHTCALGADGQVFCWGANHFGQLGDGTTQGRDRPVPVRGLGGAVQISAGTRQTCARRGDGSTVCWGANRLGQLGDGTEDKSLVGVIVGGGGAIAEPDEEERPRRRHGGMRNGMGMGMATTSVMASPAMTAGEPDVPDLAVTMAGGPASIMSE